MDNKGLIHIPAWLKFLSLAIMLVALGACFAVVANFLRDKAQENVVLVAMSFANTIVTGLAVAIVVFFSERDTTSRLLLKSQRLWLTKEFPEAMARLKLDPLEARSLGTANRQFRIDTSIDQNNLMGYYKVTGTSGSGDLTMSIIMNVFTISVFYLIPDQDHTDWKNVEKIFSVTFDGAKTLGWNTSVEPKALGTEQYRTFSCKLKLDENFLHNPRLRLYWANDIALMTRSFIIQANRGSLSLERSNLSSDGAPLT